MYLFQQKDIEKGFHGLCWYYIQQHCCFWRADLWRLFGPIPRQLRYAGDYWLWTQFAKKFPLISLNYPVATFRCHDLQLHKKGNFYKNEVMSCFNGFKYNIFLRILLRNMFRRFYFDIQILNLLSSHPPYKYIELKERFRIKTTLKPIIVFR